MKKIVLFLVLILLLSIGFLTARKVNAGIFDFLYKSKDKLSISGNNVYFNDQEIKIRGVAINSPYYRDLSGRPDSDFDKIKNDWNANVVRMSVHPGDYKRYPRYVIDSIKEQVEAARKRDLFVIIDWHSIGEPNGWYHAPYDNNSTKKDLYDSNFKLAEDFWKYIAFEYRGDRGVIFELWNEPDDKEHKINWQDMKPYMNTLYNVIRSQGAENIIIAPGVLWTYDLRGIKWDALDGYNIAYAWHNYPNNDYWMSWDTALDGLNDKYPIFVTEWGFSTRDEDKNQHYYNSSLEGFPNNFKTYLIEKDLNFTAWCWHGAAGPKMLESNWSDLTEFGNFTKNFLVQFDTIERIRNQINNYLWYGIDYNTTKLGEGERRAVVYSFEVAFGRYPETDWDYEDVIKIASGHWPGQRSWQAEERAKSSFRYIYRREPNMDHPNDNAAVTVMAYGLRQRAENRNLNSERQGIGIFRSIYGRLPSSTEDWNIMQAITYSGAVR